MEKIMKCHRCSRELNEDKFYKSNLRACKECLIDYQMKRYDKNKESLQAYQRKYNSQPKLCIYQGIYNRCHVRGDRNYPIYGGRGIQLLINYKCWYKMLQDTNICCLCNIPFYIGESKETDRINNDGHYEVSNIQFVHKHCHNLKHQNERRRLNSIKWLARLSSKRLGPQ